jgi:prephenate dehydrogenase
VVTDVGSTKRQIAGRFAGAGRFVGGHPLAGAESAGVQNARADLFEGARWYLTPTESTEGLLYDRLQSAIADFGARPQAIGAETHDRMMATVSHLPHVLANALVERAFEALADGSERMPEVGPSFRDSARVAGANPAIWPDIFASNREALAAEIDAVVERLQHASGLLRRGDAEAVGEWQGAAADQRRRLLETELVGGELCELHVSVPNQPGIVAEIALALGNAGVNIEDMSLSPAADMRSGAVSLWIAGAGEAERAAELIRGLGHSASLVAR